MSISWIQKKEGVQMNEFLYAIYKMLSTKI